MAHLLGIDVSTTGAKALLIDERGGAAAGAGIFAGVEEAVAQTVKATDLTEPIPAHARKYEALCPVYRSLYPALAPAFRALSSAS